MSVKQEYYEDDVSLSPSSPKKEPVGEGEEEFEDSLDLDMANAESKVWLVRLPRFLMDRWKNVDQVNGKDLGKVRIKNGGGSDQPWKVKLVLNDSEENAEIPLEYDINLVKRVVDNTYVFTEQDLPEYQKKADKSEHKQESRSASPMDFSGRYASRDNRYAPYVKTVPKKTALVGTACHECQVLPSLNDKNYSKVVSQRKQVMEQAEPKNKVTFLQDIPGVTAASFSNALRGNQSAFLRAQKRDIKTEGKATRLPKNELLDLLFKLFEEYDYWGMKGLRERTKQPESYLKEVLETMAVLIKKGPYAMKYTLKPEFKQIKGMGESLSEYMEKQQDKDEDDDDDVEMETVF